MTVAWEQIALPIPAARPEPHHRPVEPRPARTRLRRPPGSTYYSRDPLYTHLRPVATVPGPDTWNLKEKS